MVTARGVRERRSENPAWSRSLEDHLVARAAGAAATERLSRRHGASDAPKPGWRNHHQIIVAAFG